MLEQRWTMLVLRDLLVRPRRYSDLVQGLPGIPTGGLARRLRELEDDGLIVRRPGSLPDRSTLYEVTDRARELTPALDALARWGAGGMHQPQDGEVITEASLVTALRSGIQPPPPGGSRRQAVYEVRVADVTVHAVVDADAVTIRAGSHPAPSLTIDAGLRFRDVLAGQLKPRAAISQGVVRLQGGDKALFNDFLRTFDVPYSEHVSWTDHAKRRSK